MSKSITLKLKKCTKKQKEETPNFIITLNTLKNRTHRPALGSDIKQTLIYTEKISMVSEQE